MEIVLLGLAGGQVPDSDSLLSITGNRAARAVLGVFIAGFFPFRFGSAFTAASFKFDLVNRQPTVFWGDVVGVVGLDSTALLDALSDGAAANGLDGVFSNEAVGAWSWVDAAWALADVLEAAVGGAWDGDGVEGLWKSADLVSDGLALASSSFTAFVRSFALDFLVGVAVISGQDAWAFADLFGATVGGAYNGNALEGLWKSTSFVSDSLASASLCAAAEAGSGGGDLLVSIAVVWSLNRWTSADSLGTAVGGADNCDSGQSHWGGADFVSDGLALAVVRSTANKSSGGN